MQQRLYKVNLIQEAPFCSDLYFKMLRTSNSPGNKQHLLKSLYISRKRKKEIPGEKCISAFQLDC